ncbi:MAG: gliding motility-associated C-terminal domain-containing protein [Anaerolineae bacterium]|nr:gliding motility-associated C-terminal domain-containing protein [Anaerolineae bacterium]
MKTRFCHMGIVVGLLLAAVGCMNRPLLYGVEVAPEVMSPNADGVDDVTQIRYSISRPSHLDIYFVDSQGEKYYFRQENRRSPGEYQVYFGGTIEGRMLANGVYTYVVEVADDSTGATERAEGEITIGGADISPPGLLDFTVFPDSFTPNRDGIGDRVAINFRLTERAEVEVYLLDDQGDRYPVGVPKLMRGVEEESAPLIGPYKVELEPGIIEYDYDAGVDRGTPPPPDGRYSVVAVATDVAGNSARVEAPLTIEEGGIPLAEVRFVEFWPKIVALGETLYFKATVENVGAVPIRTEGPPPGTTYLATQNFNTLGYHESDGSFRVGVDFEGNSFGRRYPYRWQLGTEAELEARIIDGQRHLYLPPGQQVTVTGGIIIDEPPPRTGPHFWVGLIHEGVRIVNDYQHPTEISIGF